MPHVINVDSLEAAVPSNFNICTIDAETVGTLKFYGQGAGSLPTGNAIVQDVIDVSEGRTSAYDFSRPVELDETLLKGDYVVRSGVVPESSEPFMGHDGYHLVRGLVPSEAVALIEDMRKVDEAALIAAL
jgi:homoserine dehydrogenase